jgi:putative redox protein
MPKPRGSDLKTSLQVAARIGCDHYTAQIRAGRHQMTADDPEAVGGKDLGGSPYDYLLAGLLHPCSGLVIA